MRFFAFCTSALIGLALLGGCSGAQAPKKTDPAPAQTQPEPVKSAMPTPVEAIKAYSSKNAQVDFISGGWGFHKSDAMIITTPAGMNKEYFDIAPVEYVLAELRNMQELTKLPPEGARLAVMKFELDAQNFVEENGKIYDHLRGTVLVVPEKDVETVRELLAQSAKGDGSPSPTLLEKMRTLPREYWFDVTEPFTRNAKLLALEGRKAPTRAEAGQEQSGVTP